MDKIDCLTPAVYAHTQGDYDKVGMLYGTGLSSTPNSWVRAVPTAGERVYNYRHTTLSELL